MIEDVIKEMREVAGKDGGVLSRFAEKWANELEGLLPSAGEGDAEVIACELEGFGSVSSKPIDAMCKRAAALIRRLAMLEALILRQAGVL